MKKKIIAGCLLAALACSMIGCGKKKETNAPAQVDETFQQDEKDTEEDTKKDDTSADTTQAEPDNDEAVVTELKKSAAAYEAVVYAMYQPDISKDGVLGGANVEATVNMSRETGLNVIASGGVSTLDDIVRLKESGIYGAVLGRAIYDGALDLSEAIRAAK